MKTYIHDGLVELNAEDKSGFADFKSVKRRIIVVAVARSKVDAKQAIDTQLSATYSIPVLTNIKNIMELQPMGVFICG